MYYDNDLVRYFTSTVLDRWGAGGRDLGTPRVASAGRWLPRMRMASHVSKRGASRIYARHAVVFGLEAGRLRRRPSVIHVLVVSENRLHGDGLTLRRSAEPGIRAIGPRESIPEAQALAPSDEVDIVLVDIEPTPAHQQELAAAVAVA